MVIQFCGVSCIYFAGISLCLPALLQRSNSLVLYLLTMWMAKIIGGQLHDFSDPPRTFLLNQQKSGSLRGCYNGSPHFKMLVRAVSQSSLAGGYLAVKFFQWMVILTWFAHILDSNLRLRCQVLFFNENPSCLLVHILSIRPIKFTYHKKTLLFKCLFLFFSFLL